MVKDGEDDLVRELRERIGELENHQEGLLRSIRSLRSTVANMKKSQVEVEATLTSLGLSAKKTAETYRAAKKAGRSPESWGLGHDYLDDWNRKAVRFGWKKVRTITTRRAAVLLAREQEPEWNWVAILDSLETSDHRFLRDQNWWTFDFLTGQAKGDGELNYIKLLEGRYDSNDHHGSSGPRLPEIG